MHTLKSDMHRTTFRGPQSQQDDHSMDYKDVHGCSFPCGPTQKHLILRFWLKKENIVIVNQPCSV